MEGAIELLESGTDFQTAIRQAKADGIQAVPYSDIEKAIPEAVSDDKQAGTIKTLMRQSLTEPKILVVPILETDEDTIMARLRAIVDEVNTPEAITGAWVALRDHQTYVNKLGLAPADLERISKRIHFVSDIQNATNKEILDIVQKAIAAQRMSKLFDQGLSRQAGGVRFSNQFLRVWMPEGAEIRIPDEAQALLGVSQRETVKSDVKIRLAGSEIWFLARLPAFGEAGRLIDQLDYIFKKGNVWAFKEGLEVKAAQLYEYYKIARRIATMA
jgi:hypothetical protein